MPESILDAIRKGRWEYEPPEVASNAFNATQAMPGTAEKLTVMAERVRQGLPLWHPDDRLHFDETED